MADKRKIALFAAGGLFALLLLVAVALVLFNEEIKIDGNQRHSYLTLTLRRSMKRGEPREAGEARGPR